MAVQYLLSGAAALLFLVIGLEELPVSFNVQRVARSLRVRARRANRPARELLENTRRSTRRSVGVLLGFAIASALALGWRVYHSAYLAPPESNAWAYDAPIHLFSLVLVLGLFFLVFAFDHWAPRLFERVGHVLDDASEGSNPDLGFLRPRAP